MRFSVIFLLQLTAISALYITVWTHDSYLGFYGTPLLLAGCLIHRDINKDKTEFSKTVCSSEIYTLICFWAFNGLPIIALLAYVILFTETEYSGYYVGAMSRKPVNQGSGKSVN